MNRSPSDALSIIVVGASGDLARRKIFPALFALYCQDLLPESLTIMGFARSEMDDAAFRERITEHLTCRYTPGEQSCAAKMEAFLDRCHYVAGQYRSTDAMLDLFARLSEFEAHHRTNRMFYLAIPPSVFLDVARAVGNAGFVYCGETSPWSRVVIEKPFGRDRTSSDFLVSELGKVFSEGQVFRIDHYLGKEVIQNLMVLRFANLIFEPIWNRDHIRSVQINWGEQIGVEGRGGYFDSYGIVRDVVQNHLLQILALTAMEPPARLDSAAVRDEKVRVLEAVPPVTKRELVLGQYAAGTVNGVSMPGYRDDPTVPDDSLTPTFAAARLHVENERWHGVPFMIRAGKALNRRTTEIRIAFRPVEGNMFCTPAGCPAPNELLIRVQPDEAIMFRIDSKVPGVDMKLETRDLDLQYGTAFDELIPDAYEDLLLDVLHGEKSLFIRSDELAAAWDIFTPILNESEADGWIPEAYPFGSSGPAADKLLTAGK